MSLREDALATVERQFAESRRRHREEALAHIEAEERALVTTTAAASARLSSIFKRPIEAKVLGDFANSNRWGFAPVYSLSIKNGVLVQAEGLHFHVNAIAVNLVVPEQRLDNTFWKISGARITDIDSLGMALYVSEQQGSNP